VEVTAPRRGGRLLPVALLGLALPALADDPPTIEHQPIPCTIAGKPISICATIGDDSAVKRASVYFRPANDRYYSSVEMTFGGLNYCGTLPAPREGKLQILDYYVKATDDQYQDQRTSTYQMLVQGEGVCEFPPVEKDQGRAAAIRVFATNAKQGKKLADEFDPAGVTFVPVKGS
jgi:hypothetical protein